MFIVLSVNNGEGYSDPYVKVVESFEEALEKYLWCISDLLNPNKPFEMGSDYVNGEAIPGVYKTMFTSFDEDEEVNNYGVHMFPVESGDCIEIICDYVDEIAMDKEVCPIEFDGLFYQADGVEDEETGTMTIKIYIK